MIIAERPELRLKDDVAPGRPAYFWWFIANGVALCFAVASWLVCLEVFGNPEVPRNYEILRSIGRVPELKLFPADDLPDGVTLDAAGLYSRFYPSPNAQLTKFNARMLRNYLTNFDSPEAVVHVGGEYRIEFDFHNRRAYDSLLQCSHYVDKGFDIGSRLASIAIENWRDTKLL